MSLFIFDQNSTGPTIPSKGEKGYVPDYERDHLFYIYFPIQDYRVGTNLMFSAIGQIAANSKCDTFLLKHSFHLGKTEEVRITTRSPEDTQAMKDLIEALPVLNGRRWAHNRVCLPTPTKKPRALVLVKPSIAA